MKQKHWLFSLGKTIQQQFWLISIALVGIRFYVAPIFFFSGVDKMTNFEQYVNWFGDNLLLPYPVWFVWVVAAIELLGGLALLFGLAVRWCSGLLALVVCGAIIKVHWLNGWGYVARQSDPEIALRLEKAVQVLQQHADYDWITQFGSIAILSNGVELAVAYLILLLILFSQGAGLFSVDYWLSKKYR